MAREIGGIEVVLELNNDDFVKGVSGSEKAMEGLEESVVDTTKTIGRLEQRHGS